MSETKCPGCKERDERIVELEAELARPKHEVLRQLADAIERIKELEARALRMERALRTIEAWPFNIMGDCVADARALARKALEEADDE